MVQSASLDARLLRFRTAPRDDAGLALAGELLAAGRAREAREIAETLAGRGDSMQALVLSGRCWMVIGDFVQAQRAFLQAARLAPDEMTPFRWLGEVLMKRGDPERALKVLEKAKALGPTDPDVVRLHGRATRLARIAGQADEDAFAPPPVEMPAHSPSDEFAMGDEEPTVVAGHEVSQTLVEASRRSSPDPFRDPFADDAETAVRAPAPPPVKAPPVALPPKAPPPIAPPAKAQVAKPVTKAPPPRAKPPAPVRTAPAPKPAAKAAPPEPLEGLEPRGVVRADSLRPEPDDDSPSTLGLDSPLTPSVPPPAPLPDMRSAPESAPALEEPSPFADAASQRSSGAEGEDVDRVLGTLKEHGLFHPMDDSAGEWASAKDAKVRGTRVGRTLAVLWVVAMLLAGGGYFGWTQWVASKKAEAAALVTQAHEEAWRGDHADLVDAERHLREARAIDPLATEGPSELLFVLTQRVLEGGAFEAGYLRPALERARRLEAEPDLIAATEATLAFADGHPEEGQTKLAAIAESADVRARYVAGRLAQRLGLEGARGHLEAALAGEGSSPFVAAELALAEMDAETDAATALARVERLAQAEPEQLRVQLWRHYLQAAEGDAAASLASMETLAPRLDHAAPADGVLYHLTRAQLARRMEDDEAASSAVEQASLAGATEARLLILVAEAARDLGDLARAQRAVMAAVEVAPEIIRYRRLLAEILVQRRDGRRALRVLGGLPAGDTEVLRLTGLAALDVGEQTPLQGAQGAIQAFIEQQEEEEPSEEVLRLQVLAIRLRSALGESRQALLEARRLRRRRGLAPSVALDADLALGEAAVAQRNTRLALESLARVTEARPTHAEAFYLLGRAQRMAGQGEEAEASLQQALTLSPEHQRAETALAYLLLDLGKFAEADAIYTGMRSAPGARGQAARMGHIEALLGQGQVNDANTQWDGLTEALQNSARGQVLRARIALAQARNEDAVAALSPLVTGEGATVDLIALYGDALYAAGQSQEASDVYEQAIERDGGHPEALLGFAEVLIRGEKVRDAASSLEDAEESLESRIRPPAVHARLLLLQGRVALERDSLRTAREALRAAVALSGVRADAHFWLGEALAGQNAPEARAAYERYLELAPRGPLSARARRAIGGE